MKQFLRAVALFCDEPYRLFFPLGILIGFVGASHWLFYALGWVESYSGFFHASIQIQGYMSCFIGGFLMTAIPRFSSTPRAALGELLTFLFLNVANVGFLWFHQWMLAEACFILWLLALGRFIFVRMAKRLLMRFSTVPARTGTGASSEESVPKIRPPIEFVWIPIAILHGILGTALVIASQLKWGPVWFEHLGFDLGAEGFVLAIVLGVGGFLGPRLLGHFEAPKSSEPCAAQDLVPSRRNALVSNLILGLLFFASFWLEHESIEMWGHGLRSLVATVVLVRTRSLPRPPRVPDLFAWLLWVSLWMVLLGNWISTIFPEYEKATLHFMFLGGFSLMTFAVGTMVVLSHAGESARLHRPIWALWVVAFGVLCALVFRILAVFQPPQYFQWLGAAAALWLAAGASWLCFIAPRILRIPEPGTFEHQHEEMKKRVVK